MRRGSPFAAGLFCAALAMIAGAAFGWPRSSANAAESDDFVGAETCASCHETEYAQWRKSGHAMALARLTPVQQRDRTCRNCHTTLSLSEDPTFASVQCESCHGGGKLYAQRYVMKDKILSRLLGLDDIEKETCANCHTADGPRTEGFRFEDKLELVRHKPKAKSDDGRSEPALKHPRSGGGG